MALSRIAKGFLPVALIALFCGITYFFLEGLVSVSRGGQPGTSIAFAAYSHLVGDGRSLGLDDRADPNAVPLADESHIERLLDKLKADGVGLGNTPYQELRTAMSTTHTVVNGCRRHKPNMRKAQIHLITRLFRPFDPIMAFWDNDRSLDPDVASFLQRHGFNTEVVMSTNEFGDRTTLPAVEAERKVIVAGDSVANGILLNDHETIASQLQALDSSRQYINTGIAGANAEQVICAIKAAVANYGGRIDELIYIYFENDIQAGEAYGDPEEVVAWLKDFAAEHDVRRVTVVYSPFIYNVIPQLTRFESDDGYRKPYKRKEKRQLASEVSDAGFRFIDFTDIALEENREKGTMFAAFGLFVDHAHHSRLGTRKLVKRLQNF